MLLLERGKLPRQRVCGEFVSAESLDLLAALLGHGEDGEAIRISEARLFVDGRVISTPVSPAAASIARFDLDADLWAAAKSSGVDARMECAVENVVGTGPFGIQTSLGTFTSRAVVCAAGRWSNLTPKSDHNGSALEKWLGIKAHFAEESPHPSVDLYFFKGGYCGVQPVRLGDDRQGRVNACAMVRADVARTLAEVFQLSWELAERSRAWKPLMEATSTSPLIFHKPRPMQDGMLLAGDAAAFVDPFVGDGISLALRSGAMATECLVPFFKGEQSLVDAMEVYALAYRNHLAPVFRNSSRIRGLLRLPAPMRRPLVGLLARAPQVTQYLVSSTR